jgi:hypothetical protein
MDVRWKLTVLCNTSNQMLELTLPEAAREQLTRHAFVSIRRNEGAEVRETNPIIPCDKAIIDRILQQEEQHSDRLERSADRDLDDQGFEELLSELHETLIIDQDSIWNAARGQTSSQKVVPDDKGQLYWLLGTSVRGIGILRTTGTVPLGSG